MASMTSPEQGAQQECISTLLRPAGRSSLGRTSSDMADKTGKDGRCGRKNPYFTTSWRKAGRRPARPGRLSPAPSSRVRARRPARPATGRARRGPFHALQPHLVLHPAQRAVGVAGLQGQVGRDQAGFARQPQQGDIAQVAHQHRVAARMAQHQILGDEFHVHHAARVVLQVEMGVALGWPELILPRISSTSWRNAAGSRGCTRMSARMRSKRSPTAASPAAWRARVRPGAPRTRRACAGIARRLRPTPPAGRRRRPAAAAGRFRTAGPTRSWWTARRSCAGPA